MITKKHGNYYAVVPYQDLEGKLKKKWYNLHTTSIREAEKLERKYMAARDDGALIRSARDVQTLREYLDDWLDMAVRPPTKSLGTYQNYSWCCNKLCKYIGRRKLDTLTPIVISKTYRQCLSDGLSASTVRMCHRVLRTALNKAIKWKMLQVNPACDAEVPAKTKSPGQALDIGPAMELLQQSEAISLSVNAAITFGMICGLRRSEICGLRWQDWDKDKQRLYIRHGLTRRSAEGLEPEKYEYAAQAGKSWLVLDHVKTDASDSFIDARGYVEDILVRMKLRYDTNRMKFGPAYKDLGFIMCEEDGLPRDPRYVHWSVHRTIDTYNEGRAEEDQLPMLRAHDLRHTAATILLESHIDIKYVSRQLRHSSTVITRELYQHVTDAMVSCTADAMDSLIQGARKKPDAEKRRHG